MACENALHFYGGVPEVIVPDNLKSAVKKAGCYESQLNDSFAAFESHYNTYVFPVRVQQAAAFRCTREKCIEAA